MALAPQDWLIITVYLLVLFIIGVLAARRVKDTGYYFLGKRRFGKLLMMAQNFGVGTHAEMPVSLAGAVYGLGISAIWFQWKNLFATPFYWIMAPVFRRVRRTTTAEMIGDRYGAGMAGLYSLFAFAFFIINIASILKGAGKILNEVLGGSLGVNHIVLSLATIFILYSLIGGIVASTWSDCVQGLLIILLSFMLIPLGWSLVGGLHGMKGALPLEHFSLATPKEIGPWFILMLTVNGLIGIMAQPHMMAAASTGKNELTCRVGLFHGTFIKRLCTVGWALVGLMVAAIVKRGYFDGHALHDPEDAFGFACRHLLSSGFRGLLIASVMGACLASSSALMVDSGALFAQGFYRTHMVARRSDRHYLWAGRISGLVAVLIAIAYSVLLIERVLYSFLLTETLATYVGISIVGGLIWRRANRWGAISGLIVALFTNFFFYHLKKERMDYWDPNVFLLALLGGSVGLVIVSLLTRPESESVVARFFSQLQTPSDLARDGSAPRGSSAEKPEECVEKEPDGDQEPARWAAEHGRQLLFVNLLHLRRGAHGIDFFKAYRDDLRGLLMGSALCAGLVGGLWLFLQT
jgi:Na+/proline symporter